MVSGLAAAKAKRRKMQQALIALSCYPLHHRSCHHRHHPHIRTRVRPSFRTVVTSLPSHTSLFFGVEFPLPPPRGCLSSAAPPQGPADDADHGFEIEVEKPTGHKNRRRIHARVQVDADLEILWSVLTDYERLADFIPGLAVCQLLDKRDNFAKLYQVGQQDLALGLKFNAKGVLDCYEGDLERTPAGRRRDIEFRMVDGDFHMFQGRWSIEQKGNNMHDTAPREVHARAFMLEISNVEHDINQRGYRVQMFKDSGEEDEGMIVREYRTTLSYTVELEPKLWLPVRLLEGRVCKEVKTNLVCVRAEAQRVQRVGRDALPVR